jgi:hypothetical protein
MSLTPLSIEKKVPLNPSVAELRYKPGKGSKKKKHYPADYFILSSAELALH